jgi:hypothetical protein
VLIPSLFANPDIEPFDLLIQRRERNAELLGGISLVPVAALQFLDKDSALNVFEDLELGSVCKDSTM